MAMAMSCEGTLHCCVVKGRSLPQTANGWVQSHHVPKLISTNFKVNTKLKVTLIDLCLDPECESDGLEWQGLVKHCKFREFLGTSSRLTSLILIGFPFVIDTSTIHVDRLDTKVF